MKSKIFWQWSTSTCASYLSCTFKSFQGTYIINQDKLAHVQVVTNCRYSVAQMCTREEACLRIWACLLVWRHESKWAHNIHRPSRMFIVFFNYFVAQTCTREEACLLIWVRFRVWCHESKWAHDNFLGGWLRWPKKDDRIEKTVNVTKIFFSCWQL